MEQTYHAEEVSDTSIGDGRYDGHEKRGSIFTDPHGQRGSVVESREIVTAE